MAGCDSEDDERFCSGYASAATDGVDDLFEVVDVSYAQSHEGVGVACDRERFDEFWEVGVGSVDVVDLGASVEAEFAERFDVSPEFCVIDDGSVAGDDAAFLEPVDAALGGCRRESNAAADLAG